MYKKNLNKERKKKKASGFVIISTAYKVFRLFKNSVSTTNTFNHDWEEWHEGTDNNATNNIIENRFRCSFLSVRTTKETMLHLLLDKMKNNSDIWVFPLPFP